MMHGTPEINMVKLTGDARGVLPVFPMTALELLARRD
jgi:hypothetical protein